MPRSLQDVLRAGEARRQPARTGMLQMADLNDDALRLITDAIGNGDADAACRAAKNWCALNRRHRTMCQEGGDGLWDALTTRVFGADKIGAHRQDSQANFFELCRITVDREAARRWFRARHPRWTITGELQSDAFLDRLGAILAVLDNNYVGHPLQNIGLVEMLVGLFLNKPDGFPNTDLLALYSLDSLYALVRGDNDAEINGALELLKLLANDIEFRDDGEMVDRRVGYVPDMVPRLTSLLRRAIDATRQEYILGIWSGLLATTGDEEEDEINEIGRYARAVLRTSANVIVDYCHRATDNRVRHLSVAVMLHTAEALNASLTMAMHDATELGRRRMGLVYGED
jgi:hypothetical protein